MASNNLQDLNDMFFNQMVRLDGDNIDSKKLEKEIERAKAMNSIASTIVNNARVVLDACKFSDTRENYNAKLPRMLGESDQQKSKNHEE